MPSETVTLHPVESDADLRTVERLLAANDLPTADLAAHAESLYLARDGDRRVGAGGCQPLGDCGLLRSVVVEQDQRGEGYGAALVDALEARAADAGVRTCYLLTTTAAGFFAARGYERIARESVPDPVRGTTEFADLCPDAATVMRKRL